MRVSSMAPVARSLAISSELWPAAAFASTACRHVPSGIAPRLDLERPQPLAVRHDDGLVPGAPRRLALHQDQRGRGLGRRICGPAAAAGSFFRRRRWAPRDVGRHRVVALAENRRGDGDVLADDRLGRIFAEGDDGGYLVESDASSHGPKRTGDAIASQAAGKCCTVPQNAAQLPGKRWINQPSSWAVAPRIIPTRSLQLACRSRPVRRGEPTRQERYKLISREGSPTFHRPPAVACAAGAAGHSHPQPSLVVASAQPGPVRRHRPAPLGAVRG